MDLGSLSLCHFLLYTLDFLVGKAPPIFTMENKLLITPHNGGAEVPASHFAAYEALPSRLFHVIPAVAWYGGGNLWMGRFFVCFF